MTVQNPQLSSAPESSISSGNQQDSAQQILDEYFSENPKAEDEAAEAEGTEDSEGKTSETNESHTSDDADTETGSIEGAEEGEAQDREDYTLAELAAALDVEPETIYSAQVAMEDGTKIPVGKIKYAWQQARHAERDIDRNRRIVDRQAQQVQAQAQILALQPDAEEEKLTGDYAALVRAESDQAYWAQLSQQDSGKAAMAMQQVQAAKRDLETKIAAAKTSREGKAKELRDQYVARAHGEIAQRIPHWSDGSRRDQEWRDIAGVMQKYGMTTPEIEQLWEAPSAMHLVHDYVSLLRKVGSAKPAKKKVRGLNSLKSSSGISKTSGSAKSRKLAAIATRAKKGDRKAQLAATKLILGDR